MSPESRIGSIHPCSFSFIIRWFPEGVVQYEHNQAAWIFE